MSDQVPLEMQNSFNQSGDNSHLPAQSSNLSQPQYFQQPNHPDQRYQGHEGSYTQTYGQNHSLGQDLSHSHNQQGQIRYQNESTPQTHPENQNNHHLDNNYGQSSQPLPNYYPPQYPTTFNAPNNTQVTNKLVLMEFDAELLRALSSLLDNIAKPGLSEEETNARAEVDSRSVYIGNVDYGATPLELQQHFAGSGVVERVTIMTNKVTGHPKGFAYLEFSLSEGARQAVATLDGSMFRDRELKVNLKRTNVPGISTTNRGVPRGRGRGRGMMRGRGRAGFRGRGFRGQSRFLPY